MVCTENNRLPRAKLLQPDRHPATASDRCDPGLFTDTPGKSPPGPFTLEATIHLHKTLPPRRAPCVPGVVRSLLQRLPVYSPVTTRSAASTGIKPAEGFTLTVHLSLTEPCVTAIWGRSGCGKTTLLRALAGLDSLQKGSIRVNGAVWVDTERNIALAPHQRHVGFVFQDAVLFPHLSVKDNLVYGQKRSSGRPQRFTFTKVVDLLDLHALLSRNPATLSGGQKQRVAIGRSLLSQPELLLLDEPVSALDSTSRLQILQFLRRIKSICTLPMLYITHQVDEVARLADRVCIMENGRIIDEGTKVAMMHKIYRKAAVAEHRKCSSFPFHNGNDCPYDLLYENSEDE